jgi:HEAT repeat protein
LLAAFLVFAAFGQTEQDRRIAALKANLVSKDAQERSAAASALLVMESDAAIEALSATLRATGNDDARVSVLKAVRVKRDIRCLPQAVRLLDDPSPDVRRAAKEAITALPQEQVGKTLLDLLADDKASIRARALAAETLSEIRHFEAVPALIRLLDDERPALRASAELCLRRLTYLAEGPRQEPWLKWWQDNKEKTREELLEDVLRRNEARTEKLMSTAERLWTQALAGRKNLQDPKPLLEAIECELPGVRRWVAEEIVNSKVTAAYPALVRLLRDTNPGVRMAAAQGLGEVADAKDAKVVAPLILALEDLEDPVRAAAARALGNLKSGLAVPRLTPMLKDRGVAQAAAEGLGKIGDPTAAPDLSALLDNIAAPIEARRAAASALGLLHDPRTIGPLLKALDDADLRWFAIHGLGETGQAIKDEALARVLAALTGILQTDQAADNREAAAVALGRLGRVEELTVLARGANDGEQRVADRAVAAFSRIAADRIETYEQHATECGRDKLFLASARLYQAAIDRFGKAPEHAAPVQRMRHARPEMLIKAGEWRDAHEALKRLMALDSKTPC